MSDVLISQNLRRLRIAQGMTQEQVAEAAGISREAYRNLETGASVPQVEALYALARALKVRIQDLVSPVAEPGDRTLDFFRTILEPADLNDLDPSSRDLTDDRLLRLVRRAVESDAITLSRGAEILGISLLEMRRLSASWMG